MYKGVYSIEKWKGVRTWFHKKYYVFDGISSVFFDTLSEARIYVVIKSEQLENLYSSAKTIYRQLSEYYLEKLIKFRLHDSTNNIVNGFLKDCLDGFKLLSRGVFPQYAISKLKYIYDCFLSISRHLKMRVLYKTIEGVKNSFYTPYPRYNSNEKDSVSAYYDNIGEQISQHKKLCKGVVASLGIDSQHQKLAN